MLRALVLLSLISSTAFADDAAVAREHYKKGTRLYELNKFADAAAEYEQAYQAKDDPALLFNIGQAYRFDGQNKKALLAYKQYLRKLPEAGNRAEVEKHIAALEKLVEDEKRSTSSPPTETIPPPHEAAPAAAVSAAPVKAEKPIYKKWWLWTTVGLGAAALAIGLGVGLTQASSPTERTLPTIGP
jgi:tetratricopeptide (TPR) repeat protein